MAAKNDITGDSIRSKLSNSAFDEGWDRIFGKKDSLCKECGGDLTSNKCMGNSPEKCNHVFTD